MEQAKREDDLEGEVYLWKAVIEEKPPAHDAEVLDALGALRALGDLPTQLFADTKIGRVVATVAADAARQNDVRSRAKDLVDEWRLQHRKRKNADRPDAATATAEAPQAPQRGGFSRLSSGLSFFEDTVGAWVPKKEPKLLASADGAKAASRQPPPRAAASRQPQPRDAWRKSLTASLCAAATGMSTQEDSARDSARNKVAEKVLEALGKAAETQANDGDLGAKPLTDSNLSSLADAIEGALYAQLRKNGNDADYKSQARSIIFNLKDATNPTFGFRVLSGRLKAKALPTLTAEDMASNERQAERAKTRKEATEALELDWMLRHGQLQVSGMFTCGKCKQRKTTYYQLQTRSSDEPMTTFVQCLNCRNRWRFC